MEPKKINPKLLLIITAILAAVILLFVVYNGVLIKKPASSVSSPGGILKQDENVIPTVDAGVQVDLVKGDANKDVTLKLQGIPSGTATVDYELSYQERTKGLQGAIGTITIATGETTFSKHITLGTCSSGKCVYHEVVGNIKVTLKFTGVYGDKIFEKEYVI